ncbi:hypothetical protein JOC74_000864 [Bacillus capparidis]|uniref:Uncharacterized protein n=1 Tax=Bacillus capparidis TaxID=1840411 RepID=A0ABS4CS29_9BACI|nr:hypothetical protein [Bacillus capparidis]
MRSQFSLMEAMTKKAGLPELDTPSTLSSMVKGFGFAKIKAFMSIRIMKQSMLDYMKR